MANYNPYFHYPYPLYDSAQQQQPALPDQLPWAPIPVDPSKEKGAIRERWQFGDEQVLIQLWADNINRLESKDSRKVWEQIVCTLNEKTGVKKSVDQYQRKSKHLKNQYKDKKDWNRRQSGGNLRKSPHYDAIDQVLGCRDAITCKNVQQLGIGSVATPPETSNSAADGPSTPSLGTSSSTSSTDESTKRLERKKTKRPKKRVHDGDSDPEEETFKETMKSLTAEGQQMNRIMEGMQQSQAQQLQLMTQLLGSFNRYMESKQAKKD